jgi:hypothetical protein
VGTERLTFAAGQALVLAVVAILVAVIYGLPLRDPDGVFGPTYIRLPLILVLVFLADVLPRVIARTRHVASMPAQFTSVVKERWPLDHARFALLGLGSWYLTYVAFRNLKSFVPFVNPRIEDDHLASMDRVIWFGHDPAVVLHHLLGTGVAAYVMSGIYLAWLGFVPFTIAAALVWSRNVTGGAWFVTAMAVDWVLGVATYFMVPTLGPIYARPEMFNDLPHTGAAQLQQVMFDDRFEVLADPWATHAVQSIAAFASLHVGMMVTVCIIAHFLGLRRSLRYALWGFLALTVVATVYLGWHYFVDTLGGFVVGAAGVWIAALATGNKVPWIRQTRVPQVDEEPDVVPVRETTDPGRLDTLA